jgi:iron complex transport system substrate-binding protein
MQGLSTFCRSIGARAADFVVIALAASACSPAPPARAAATATARRIVPASATAADIVCALVGPERVAGFPSQAADYSALHSERERWSRTAQFASYQAEPILALSPDLVVVCPYQARDTTARLREAGVAIFELPEIATVAQARASLLSVGDLLGEHARADSIVRSLDERVAKLAESAPSRKGLRAMCYSNFGAQGWTAGAKTTIDEIMRLAGLTNVAASNGREGHRTIGFEELILVDPDLILVGEPLTSTQSGSAGDRGGASEALLYAESSLKSLRAVRERRVVALPAWLFATASQEMVTGAEVLAARVDALLAAGANR